jgi:hypothetical protein
MAVSRAFGVAATSINCAQREQQSNRLAVVGAYMLLESADLVDNSSYDYNAIRLRVTEYTRLLWSSVPVTELTMLCYRRVGEEGSVLVRFNDVISRVAGVQVCGIAG